MVDTLHPPYAVIATWPHPNYINPDTRGPALAQLCIALSAVGTLIVSARLYSRLFITRAPGFDDALIVIALAFGIALSVLVFIGNTTWWSGHHVWDIPISKFAGHRLNIWNAEWCYVISTSATKISVLLFYRRISIKFSKAFMIATYVGIVFNVLYMFAFCLVLLLLCSPINAYWDSFSPIWVMTHAGNHCGKENIELPLSGVFSVIGDFYSALLPIVIIFNLKLSSRQKLSLYALFSLAFLIVAAGIARTVLMYQLMNKDYDFTWVLWEMWIWGLVELYVAILAASAPALKPFIRQFLVEPLKSATNKADSRQGIIGPAKFQRNKSTASKSSRQNIYGSRNSTQDTISVSKKRLSLRESALIEDPENIGVAYGGMGSLKSCEECIDQEVDNDDLETRQYELRKSKEGKVVAIQVWNQRPKSSKSMMEFSRSETNTTITSLRTKRSSVPTPAPALCAPLTPVTVALGKWSSVSSYSVPVNNTAVGYHVRNFSLPYAYPHTAPATPTGTSKAEKRYGWSTPPVHLPPPVPVSKFNSSARKFQKQQLRSI